jgi:hypothetical protein
MIKTEKRFMLNLPVFIMAMAAGVLYVYLWTPHKKVIIRQPTPQNVGKVMYEDEHENCFVLEVEKVSC